MKKIFLVLSIILFQVFSAQTAKEIIDKNIENSGGLVNWKLLNSVVLHGKVSLGVNDIYPIKIFQHRPNLTKTVLTIAGKSVPIEGYDGTNAYGMNYATNKLQKYSDYTPESFDNDFIDWEKKGFVANFLGKEKIGDVVCYKVELSKNVNKTIYYFNTKNYMLVREIQKDETLNYSDYRKEGNLLFPFRIESSSSQKNSDYVMLINKIEINKVFPPNTFKF